MVDQELDALLVGALYGELAPADEARLAAHLESHPTDRTALDDLRSTRETFRDSHFFDVDPPASVSALLLQEAARRAPSAPRVSDPESSWLARLARAFAARPALAAAMTLVVVVGVAGALFKHADPDVAAPSAVAAAKNEDGWTPAAPPAALGAAPAGAAAPAATDRGDAANADKVVVDLADKKEEQAVRRASIGSFKGAAPATPAVMIAPKSEPQPKDMDGNADDERSGGGAGAGHRAYKLSPKPSPQKPADQVAQGQDELRQLEPQQNAQQQQNTQLAAQPDAPPPPPPPPPHGNGDDWARGQHARVTTLVRDGHCQDAAPIAVEIRNRAPSYYSANVANDRALAPCQAYIAGAVEKQEASEKASAAKAAPTNAR